MDALATLRERVEILEERIRQIGERYASYPMWAGLRLSPSQTIILDALSDGAVWRSARLNALLDNFLVSDDGHGGNVLKVHICKLRVKLGICDPPLSITSLHGIGYRLAEASVPILAALRVS